MNDAFGNPIVMGASYTVFDGTHMGPRASLITGIATKILDGKQGKKVTLELTKVEALWRGETERVSTEDITRTVSYLPRHLFPTQNKSV